MMRVKDIMSVMIRLPSCCLLTSTLTLTFLTCVLLDVSIAESTTKPTTTETPFIKSTMFVGLAAGIGGFLAFIILCCVLWKCCCGERND